MEDATAYLERDLRLSDEEGEEYMKEKDKGELINTKEDKELSLQEIQMRAANKLFESIDEMNINETTIESAETIVNSLVKVMNVRLG